MKSKSKKTPTFELIEFPNNSSWTLDLPTGSITLSTNLPTLSYEHALFLITRAQYIMHRDAEELTSE